VQWQKKQQQQQKTNNDPQNTRKLKIEQRDPQ
jgi:hypothetical protein